MSQYSESQIKDVKEREAQALAYLKEMHLTPAVSMQMNNMGNDTFGIMPVPFLQDTLYTPTKSPIQNDTPASA